MNELRDKKKRFDRKKQLFDSAAEVERTLEKEFASLINLKRETCKKEVVKVFLETGTLPNYLPCLTYLRSHHFPCSNAKEEYGRVNNVLQKFRCGIYPCHTIPDKPVKADFSNQCYYPITWFVEDLNNKA